MQFIIVAYAAALTAGSAGDVYICPGEPQTFLCEVLIEQGSLQRLQWRIDFDHEDTHSVTTVNGQYTTNDPEGHIIRDGRPGFSFMFNLTSNSPSSLVSVMTVTANDTNTTAALINNATVNCAGDDAYPKVLHVYKGIIASGTFLSQILTYGHGDLIALITEGPPSSLLNLIHDLMQVQWNPVDMADHYIISVSSLVESGSILFIASNTTIITSFAIQPGVQHQCDG